MSSSFPEEKMDSTIKDKCLQDTFLYYLLDDQTKK